MRDKLGKLGGFLLNPHFVVCFGLAWMITNGWSYIFFGVGTHFGITWMTVIGGAYMAFLWFPFTKSRRKAPCFSYGDIRR